ncbi:MAG: glutamine-hydrolyzing carbamoyl-phosphate synthase small subunit, partial [Spirochaetia bacterium]|nr:glutamine-hydrolyzing carbamoyl-phosphate synthase small subunit [Spirochaetia bacterium]
RRQIVTMTYPMIGNYGINPETSESDRIQASGFVVKEYVDRPSNHTSRTTLSAFLRESEIPAMQGIDTRRLVLELRSAGAQRGGIFVGREYSDDMLDRVRAVPDMNGLDLAVEVTTRAPYTFGRQDGKRYRLAVLDFGVKRNILRLLDQAGFAVNVFPADTTAEVLLGSGFDAFFLSNGPGDPSACTYAVKAAEEILKTGKPVFGICLGHQIIGLAEGRSTYKLRFGHRGGNQPVKNFDTGRVEITSQNHGFAVRESDEGARISHINLNDKTVEDLFHEFYNLVDHYYAAVKG